MWLDTIRLSFGHSLIAGRVPDAISLAQFEAAREQRAKIEIASYGLFDTATPNFSSYYPDVTAEDLQPKDSEFIKPVFRALSEVVVHKAWNPVDFSVNGVLKKSMGLLKGQSVYPNHEAVVGNELGSVLDVAWENATKQDNIDIPAGINSILLIDGKSNPKIARGIMMDPPSVHSTSVTVQFLWEKSHPSLTEQEFLSKLGTYDKDGRLITRVATQVKRYNEISLVGHGADPYAQKKGKDGKIVNPVFADNTYKLSEQDKSNQFYFFYDYKLDILQNSESTIPERTNITETSNNETSHETSPSMKKELLLLMAAIAGLQLAEGKEATQDDIVANQDTIEQRLTALVAAEKEVERLKAIETQFNEKKVALEEAEKLKGFRDTALSTVRNNVTTLLNKLTDNKPSEAMVGVIAQADFTALAALEKDYQTQLDEKYPLTCGDCGKSNISRASSMPADKGEQKAATSLDELVRRKQGSFLVHQEKN